MTIDPFNNWKMHASPGYRHYLGHRFDFGPMVLCIGINPSTAIARQHDATTATIERIARFNGFGAWAIVNVFDVIETDSRKLASFRVSWRSEQWSTHLRDAAQRCGAIWPCWGNTPRRLKALGMARETLATILDYADAGTPVVCAASTKDGDPRHPLYMPNETTLKPWRAEDCKGWPKL